MTTAKLVQLKIHFFSKKENKINPHLYLLSLGNNVRAGEADTSAEVMINATKWYRF